MPPRVRACDSCRRLKLTDSRLTGLSDKHTADSGIRVHNTPSHYLHVRYILKTRFYFAFASIASCWLTETDCRCLLLCLGTSRANRDTFTSLRTPRSREAGLSTSRKPVIGLGNTTEAVIGWFSCQLRCSLTGVEMWRAAI